MIKLIDEWFTGLVAFALVIGGAYFAWGVHAGALAAFWLGVLCVLGIMKGKDDEPNTE